MGEKIGALLRKFFSVVTIGMAISGIVIWFGIIPLMATVFYSIFTGLEFLIIMAMMIALIVVISKIVWDVEF